MIKRHTISGGGGIQLHLVETGNSKGRPIVFIHGFSQCWLAWSRQMTSDLADDYRLVAMDMRGHGRSDKPREGYADSRLWADDVNAVIQVLSLDHPVLCGWSYGPLVVLDYVRHYGEDGISGVNFVGSWPHLVIRGRLAVSHHFPGQRRRGKTALFLRGEFAIFPVEVPALSISPNVAKSHFVNAITKLGSDQAMSVITPEFLSLVPGFFATDVEESVRSLTSLLRMCFAQEPTADELYLMLGYNVSVPPYVREALFSRSFDNDDLLPKMHKPALITHGAEDVILKRAVVDQHKAGMAHAQIHMMANAGHAPFWDDATTFNQRLRAFCEYL